MKLLYFVLFINFFSLRAQSINQQIKKAEYLVKKDKLSEAKITLMTILPKVDREYGNVNKTYDKISVILYQILLKAEKKHGKNNINYIELLFLSASVNTSNQKARSAFYQYKQVVYLYRKIYKTQEKFYIVSLQNLPELYVFKGNIKEAEKLYFELVEQSGKVFGVNNPIYLKHLNEIGDFFYQLSNFKKAEIYSKKIIDYIKKRNDLDNIEYITAINNLANIHLKTKKIAEANKIYVEILPLLIKRQNDIRSEHFERVINLLGHINFTLSQYSNAEKYYNRLIDILEIKVGKKHTRYAAALNNLALCQSYLNKSKGNNELYFESLEIIKNTKGKNSNEYKTLLDNISEKLLKQKNTLGAKKHLLEHNKIDNKNILEKTLFMSEKEKEYYINNERISFFRFNTYCFNVKEESPEIIGELYNSIILRKGILLESSSKMKKQILESTNSNLKSKYKDFLFYKKQLNEIDLDSNELLILKAKANKLEKYLISESQNSVEYRSTRNIKWQSIRNKLKKDEVAIEFINFKYYQGGYSGETYYCALILKHNSEYPKLVFLFKEKDLIGLSTSKSSNEGSRINSLYDPNNRLYYLIWKPLESSIKGIKTINYSLSGILHKISFSCLNQGNNYLITKNNLSQLSNTASIAKNEIILEFNNINKVCLFGGIDYGEGESWDYLKGTEEEVLSISKLLLENGIKSEIYTKKEATESVFKERINSVDIIHLATHGFIDEKASNQPIKIKKELTFNNQSDFDRSSKKVNNSYYNGGLVFANANQTYNQEKNSNGILTNEEVTELNLLNTKLVVLSACDTGLGDIKNGEGVYGLQRSFKIAGVKNLIISLWKVPDNETKEFMTIFYKQIFKQKNINLAFNESQRIMSKKYSPYYWGAFVLIQ